MIIKCRAWDVERKTWADYGFCLRFDALRECTLTTAFGAPFTHRTLILSFWTGLRDKNGREIYDGDICAIEEYGKVSRFRVYWNEDRWGLQDANDMDYDNGDYYRGDDINNWNEFEVIGNMWETPALL